MTRLRDIGLREKLVGACGIVLVFGLLLSGTAYYAAVQNENMANALNQSHIITTEMSRFRNLLLGMNAGYRGFLLTGRSDYIQSYLDGKAGYKRQLQNLREKTLSTHVQQGAGTPSPPGSKRRPNRA